MQLQQSDCRNCHAADLSGSLGPSCDDCHTPAEPLAWRTDCVFCHGGVDNLLGSPPRDLAGVVANISFPGHTSHVTVGIAGGFDCVQCHVKAVDVLSPGHAFDDTKGVAEVDLAGGLSPQGTYNGAGTCSNLYCHGNGRGNNGSAVDGAAPMQCDSCHPGMGSSENAWGSMSGEHRKHLQENFDCGECHLEVTSDGMSIQDPLQHVDGINQVQLANTGITYNGSTRRCAGGCHGKSHDNEGW
jgi:predicted CxxxxCH...CXXCH cytochrome family protein